MFHTVAYFESVPVGTGFTDVNAVSDGILNIQNNHIVPFADMDLIAAYAGSANLSRARLNSPKIRQIAPSHLRPFSLALLPPTDPNVMVRVNNPYRLRKQEEIQVEAVHVGAAPENFFSVLWLQENFVQPVRGDVTTLVATSSTAVVAAAWSPVPLGFETIPPQGIYEVIGAEGISATAISARFTFDNQYWRPGALGQAGVGGRSFLQQYNGGLGVWGRFDTVTLPRCEFLCNAADASEIVFLEIVRVGTGFKN